MAVCCRRQSDDARWLEQIDTASVHLYAGLKVLWAVPERDQDVIEARALVDRALSGKPGTANEDAGLDDGTSLSDEASQALASGRALLKLRALGRDEVHAGRKSELRLLLEEDPTGPLARQPKEVQTATEHGLLLVFLTLSRLGDSMPVEVPDEVLLYEAYLSELVPLHDDDVEGLIRAAQASITAKSELCDVAKRFFRAPREHSSGRFPRCCQTARNGAWRGRRHFEQPAHAPVWTNDPHRNAAAALPWMMRLLAFVRSARCFEEREQHGEALTHWQRGLDVAQATGLPEAELAPLRAYVAYRAADFDEVRRQLRLSAKSSLLTDAERSEMLEVAEHFSPEDRGMLEAVLDGLLMVRFCGGLIATRLDEAGFFDELLSSQSLTRARRVWSLATDSEQAFSSADETAGAWERLWGWVQGLS